MTDYLFSICFLIGFYKVNKKLSRVFGAVGLLLPGCSAQLKLRSTSRVP